MSIKASGRPYDEDQDERPSARRRRTSKGNVLVESALIFLMFFSMLIGVFDFGQFLFIHQSLVERVRSAARWEPLTTHRFSRHYQHGAL
jgi:hypothetical protein